MTGHQDRYKVSFLTQRSLFVGGVHWQALMAGIGWMEVN
jgi:hypothetical protein